MCWFYRKAHMEGSNQPTEFKFRLNLFASDFFFFFFAKGTSTLFYLFVTWIQKLQWFIQTFRKNRMWHKVNILSGFYQVWIQSTPSPKPVFIPSLESLVALIFTYVRGRLFGLILLQRRLVPCKMQADSSRIWNCSPNQFLSTITITLRVPSLSNQS